MDSPLEGARFEPLVPRADKSGLGYSLLITKSLSARGLGPDLAISAGELPDAGAQTIDVWKAKQARRRKLAADLAPTSTPFLNNMKAWVLGKPEELTPVDVDGKGKKEGAFKPPQ